jgi:hypothetical protein
MKNCTKCKQSKTYDQFYKNVRSNDGYHAYCKECSNEYARNKRGSKKIYRKRGFISDTHKECTACRTVKPFDKFSKNSSSASGLHSWCKECMTENVLDRKGGRTLKKMIKTETHKQCRICEQIKPYSEYAGKDSKTKQKESYCIECKKFMGSERVLKKYGLNVDSYMKLFNDQNGLCKICNNAESSGKRLSVDHDHRCCSGSYTCGNCIRGLICFRCNAALGMVSDDTEILQSMIKYLQK